MFLPCRTHWNNAKVRPYVYRHLGFKITDLTDKQLGDACQLGDEPLPFAPSS